MVKFLNFSFFFLTYFLLFLNFSEDISTFLMHFFSLSVSSFQLFPILLDFSLYFLYFVGSTMNEIVQPDRLLQYFFFKYFPLDGLSFSQDELERDSIPAELASDRRVQFLSLLTQLFFVYLLQGQQRFENIAGVL
jgi:hypothetical protein